MSGPIPIDLMQSADVSASIVARSAFLNSGHRLTRTATTSATWSFSVWVQRLATGATQKILGDAVQFNSSDQLVCNGLTSSDAYRDTTGFYHIFCNPTGAYINGELVTGTGTYSMAALVDAGISDAVNPFIGYIAQAVLIDGAAHQPSDCAQQFTTGSAAWWVPQTDIALEQLAGAAGGQSFALTGQIANGLDGSVNANNFSAVGGLSDTNNGSNHTPSDVYVVANILDPLTTATVTDGGLTIAGGNATLSFLPLDGPTYYFEKDGVAQTTTTPSTLTLTAGSYNFGQRPFVGVPSGNQILMRRADMPTPTAQGADNFNALLYTGTGADQAIMGAGFTPALAWIKNRSTTDPHKIVDSVRGATKELLLNTTAIQADQLDGVRSFDSDGITLDAGANGYNDNAENFVAWCFREGVALDIVSFTGNASASQQVAHSLGSVPAMMVVKNLDAVGNWFVFHTTLGNTQTISLNSDSNAAASTVWNNTDPTSTHFTVGGLANTDGQNYVAYLIPSTDGLTKVSSYTGNGVTAGPYVDLGFRPRFLMVKESGVSDPSHEWFIVDTARPATVLLEANEATAEQAHSANFSVTQGIELYSNGFRIRSGSGVINGSGRTYIYVAIADAAAGGTLAPLPAGPCGANDATTSNVAPTFVTNPTITGTAEIGQTLTYNAGTHDGTETITSSHEWLGPSDNVLQNGGNYIVQASDYGTTIRVRQSLSGPGGNAQAISAATATIPAVAPSFNGNRPTVTTGGKVGDSIAVTGATGITGTPTPTNDDPAFTVRDITDLNTVVSSDATTYTWQPADVGKTFIVRQHVTNPGGDATGDSLNIGPIALADEAPANTTLPSIAPTSVEAGNVLTCDPGQWSGVPAPALTFRWTNGGVDISGATASTYTTVNPDDVGDTISCNVTADNGVGSPVTVGSSNTVQPTAPSGGSWQMTDLGASLLLYCAQADIPSGAVSQWGDSSGNDRHLTQSDIDKQAVGTLAQFVAFDGANDNLFVAITGLALTDISVFVLRSSNDNKSIDVWSSGSTFGLVADSGSTSTVIDANFGTPSYYLNGVLQSFTTRQGAHTALNTNAPELVESIGANTSTWTGFNVAGYVAAGFTADADVYAVAVVSGPLSQSDRERIEGRLLWDAGLQANLPAGHPYENSAP